MGGRIEIDGVAAAQLLLQREWVDSGGCLYYCWLAYKGVGAYTDMYARTALSCWEQSTGQHPGDRNPPAGVPVHFGTRTWGPNPEAGDITISLDGGLLAVTEPPGRNNRTGTCTIAEREAQIGRPYLGWTEMIFDQPIAYHREPAPAAPTATRPKEVDMIAVHAKDLLPNWRFVIGPGYIKNAPNDEAMQYAQETGQGMNELDNDWLLKTIWTHGLSEVVPSGSIDELKTFLLSLENGKFYVASWLGDGQVHA